jgi:putative hydrolase of the HAD superfamily
VTAAPKPDVLLLDLDGVLRRWDPGIMSTAEAKAGLPSGTLAETAFGDCALLLDAVTGIVSDEEWRREITRRLSGSFGAAAAVAVASWSEPAGAVDQDVLTLLRAARARVQVALFSNATSRLPRDLEALGLIEEVDTVVNSSDLGLAKPEPAAFRAAARVCGRAPRECLFVDDTAANVAGARSVGMAAHVFTSASDLRDLLITVGLVDASVT